MADQDFRWSSCRELATPKRLIIKEAAVALALKATDELTARIETVLEEISSQEESMMSKAMQGHDELEAWVQDASKLFNLIDCFFTGSCKDRAC
jgi:hypothetical protein